MTFTAIAIGLLVLVWSGACVCIGWALRELMRNR